MNEFTDFDPGYNVWDNFFNFQGSVKKKAETTETKPPVVETKPVQETQQPKQEQPKADAFLDGASDNAKMVYTNYIKADDGLLGRFNSLKDDQAKKSKLEELVTDGVLDAPDVKASISARL